MVRSSVSTRRLVGWALSVLVLGYPATGIAQATDHPRLWIRSSDLTRLRSWAVASNPFYQDGLAPLAAGAKADMDGGSLPTGDDGSNGWEQYPNEMYSMLFAFMSLVENDPAVRADYASRARTLLMYVMDRASLGASSGVPFRDPEFSTRDRSRWWGEGFALTVDWIYPSLSAADKVKIQTVFLRWSDENNLADTTDHNHPEPVGVFNDPALLANPRAVRYSVNNYYLAHMRNLGLMALAMDSADDPGGSLGAYLENATGAWLYVSDNLLRNQALGGFSPEGLEYGPPSLGSAAQFLLALHTSGHDDPVLWGPQVVWSANPFWDEVVPAYLHSLSPATTIIDDLSWLGPVYQPAWYGDGQGYWLHDGLDLMAPMAIYAESTGDASRLEAIRWIASHTPPGGSAGLLDRVGAAEDFRHAILYFLIFDPGATTASDPRPAMPKQFFAPGLGRLLARASWAEDAAFFTYNLGWSSIDHQLAEGNQFELYRDGEWLTKGRVGWDGTSELCTIGRSDYHNNLAVENDLGTVTPGDWLALCQEHGSQWIISGSDDGEILAHSETSTHSYALGDATDLYNSDEFGSQDIQEVSRSVLWLPPDHVVVHDRAVSLTAGRFKRFWLNLPTDPVIQGETTTTTLASGQQLFVETVLPEVASISASIAEDLPDVADGEPMQYRLLVEAPGGPTDATFLHVLQGADSGDSQDGVSLVRSILGTPFEGAVFGTKAALFPEDRQTPFTTTTYRVPLGTTHHWITGLSPGAGYQVTKTLSSILEVTLTPGGSQLADSGGVLHLAPLEPPLFADGFESGDLGAWSAVSP